ncbi:MAG: hypothetical protein R2882_11965 [Gemmatimonadales bacterium]
MSNRSRDARPISTIPASTKAPVSPRPSATSLARGLLPAFRVTPVAEQDARILRAFHDKPTAPSGTSI